VTENHVKMWNQSSSSLLILFTYKHVDVFTRNSSYC